MQEHVRIPPYSRWHGHRLNSVSMSFRRVNLAMA